MAFNPELILDAVADVIFAMPRYTYNGFRRLAATAYARLIPSRSAALTSAPVYLALGWGQTAPEASQSNQFAMGILLILIFGWWLSAFPPARPADRG